ncbi:uncharacterized protein LOC107433338 [Ziziphus jujuba]|uniref:Uncharacterized protein LOC107433338 n=1 Tax=Ziziphus jujuba TaxID=326968 RepID=A0ABM3I4Y9_ZIZJJ|nr:uncharacterized protein LOC107433338 [Ziziphus jujuba]
MRARHKFQQGMVIFLPKKQGHLQAIITMHGSRKGASTMFNLSIQGNPKENLSGFENGDSNCYIGNLSASAKNFCVDFGRPYIMVSGLCQIQFFSIIHHQNARPSLLL